MVKLFNQENDMKNAKHKSLYRRRDRLIIVDLISPILAKYGENLRIIDGGAGTAPLLNNFWRAIPSDLIHLFGFDIDPKEAEAMNEAANKHGKNYKYFGVALGEQNKQEKFRHTSNPAGSSFFQPNLSLIERWRYNNGQAMTAILHVEKETNVECTSVDDWCRSYNIPGIDFLKLNIQASELSVLKGAHQTLNGVVGLQLEASFVETYKSQPLFADIDQYLRKHMFVFFDFLAPNFIGRMRSPIFINALQTIRAFRWPSRQIFEGHFLWLKDPIAGGVNLTEIQVLKLVCVAEIYGQVEYAFELLVWLRERNIAEGRSDKASEVDYAIKEAEYQYKKLFKTSSLKLYLKRLVNRIYRKIFLDNPFD